MFGRPQVFHRHRGRIGRFCETNLERPRSVGFRTDEIIHVHAAALAFAGAGYVRAGVGRTCKNTSNPAIASIASAALSSRGGDWSQLRKTRKAPVR